MSQKAKRNLEAKFEDTNEFAFEALVNTLSQELGVKPVTSRTYVHDYCLTEKRSDERYVVGLKDAEDASHATGPDSQNATMGDSHATGEPSIGEPTGDLYGNLPVLEDSGHPRVPQLGHGYFKRKMTSRQTDIDVITHTMADGDFATLLEGETGTGKDTAILHIAEKTNRPVIRENLGEDVTEEKLIGEHKPTEDGHFAFEDGLLTKAVKCGYIFVADEINAAPPEVMIHLNSLLENEQNRHLNVNGEVIKPHPEFMFVGTQNPPEMGYGGTEPLNDAFANRFYKIEMDYLESRAEAQILQEQTDLSGPNAKQLAEMAERIRGRYQEGDIFTPVSPRTLIKVGKMMEIMSLGEAVETVLLAEAKPEDTQVFKKVISNFFDID